MVDECLARGRALTFLLSNDDCQLLCFVKQCDSGWCSGRMFHYSWYLCQTVMPNILVEFKLLHILQSLCKLVEYCQLLTHVSHSCSNSIFHFLFVGNLECGVAS